MQKTLLISEIFPPIHGGSGRWFWELYSRLGNNYVIAAGKSTNCNISDNDSNLKIYRLPLKSAQWGVANLSALKFYFKSFFALKKIVKSEDIHLIHCGRVLPEGLLALLLKKTMGIKYMCYVHGEDLEASALSRELNTLTKLVMRNSDRIICNSRNSENIVKRIDSSVSSKIVVMHPGADTKRFVPIEFPDQQFLQKMRWSNKKIILTVGRLQARKGQDFMINAMPNILKTCPDAHYVVIGNGECEGLLRDTIDRLNLSQHVDVLTDCDDETMIACYQHCDVFILPNRTVEQDVEGFGMVLVEAQACGKPVIAGDSGGTVETLIPGKTGEIIDATSIENIESVVSKFLLNTDICREYGESGREHAVAQFDWDNAASHAKNMFELQSPEKSQPKSDKSLSDKKDLTSASTP